MRELPLDKLTSEFATLVTSQIMGCNVLHVENPQTLIQSAGYLKYVRAKHSVKSVFYRGQHSLYPTITPSLYRGNPGQKARGNRDSTLNRRLNQINKEEHILRAVPKYVREPLLQHYGLRTRWLDVVDNVWIALWFACHTAYAFGRYGQYLHFEKRVPRLLKPEDRFAYILLIESTSTPNDNKGPGCYKDATSETIDLRVAAPSHFIRPHAQHGLVVNSLESNGSVSPDFSSLLAGVIRIDLESAIEWLGSGDLLNVHALFPAPRYDYGYQEILNNLPSPSVTLGAIHLIGVG